MSQNPNHRPLATRDPRWFSWFLIGTTYLFLGAMLLVPLIFVFSAAFERGWQVYLDAWRDPDALHATILTLRTVAVVVPIHLVFGIGAAWLLTRFNFKGKHAIDALLDLPLAVSPVIVGLMLVLLFGVHSGLGGWLERHGIGIIFSWPGIVLATLFISLPYLARELVATMEAQGTQEEEAALVMGAKGWQVFWYVSLPKMRWGMAYGVILCSARALGEFGAVSVVSGHIRGSTNTLPLHVEILYNEFQFAASFAVASLLTLLAVATLVIKRLVLRRFPH